MIPLRLRLRNFMSYGLEGGDLDFRAIHLACLSGSNGHGKSTLIDAMTWAVWGSSRAPREDDLVRAGATDMEVEFEFGCRGGVYRVIRKRAVRKSSSVADLQLAIWDNEAYKAITGASIAETERTIVELLGLTYETFINSSLLLQGKADLFTVKPPRERKAVLAEILELGFYDRLAERAREHERKAREGRERYSERLGELERILVTLPDVQRLFEAGEAQIALERERITAVELTVSALDGQVRAAQGLMEQIAARQKRIGELTTDKTRLEQERTAALRREQQALTLLADENEVRAQVDELGRFRIEADRLGSLAMEAGALGREKHEQDQAIVLERRRIEYEIGQSRQRLLEARKAGETLDSVQAALDRVRQELAAVPGLEEQVSVWKRREAVLTTSVAELAANIKAGGVQVEEQRKRIRQLRAADAACPICGTPLTDDSRSRAERELIEAGKGIKQGVEEWEVAKQQLEAELAAGRRAGQADEREIERLRKLATQEATFLEQCRRFTEQAGRVAPEQETLTLLEEVLAANRFAEEPRAVLEVLVTRIAALGYDAVGHEMVRLRVQALQPAEARLVGVISAREEAAQARMTAEARMTLLVERDAELERLNGETEILRGQVSDLPAVRKTLAEQRLELEAVRGREATLQQRIGGLHRQIEDGERCKAEHTAAVEARAAVMEREAAMKELALAFGRNGIPAMLIENALPELEQDANELLGRMTDNSTQVTFLTQRQAKSGKAIETLDIRIADSAGTRPYEMFSGGEAFRINLAIRIALSRLLARRAGADLRFLLIDEGFGSQDAQGRDRLVEAIAAIADDFEKILVVTHIDELKERFDTHIEVTKGEGGSRVQVITA